MCQGLKRAQNPREKHLFTLNHTLDSNGCAHGISKISRRLLFLLALASILVVGTITIAQPKLSDPPALEFPVQKRSDVIIAVMGLAGTGTSMFIQLTTKNDNLQAGRSDHDQPSGIEVVHYFEQDGRRVTFLNTPGFDNFHDELSFPDVLAMVTTFLDVEFKGKNLDGIIFLHRITDNRMGGISVHNLKTFQNINISASDPFKNVVVITTHWDEVEKTKGGDRENELINSPVFFQPLAAAGTRFFRHDNTFDSSCKIMEKLLDNDPIVLVPKYENEQERRQREMKVVSLDKNFEKFKERRDEMKCRLEKQVGRRISRKRLDIFEGNAVIPRLEKFRKERKPRDGPFVDIKQDSGPQKEEFEKGRKIHKEESERRQWEIADEREEHDHTLERQREEGQEHGVSHRKEMEKSRFERKFKPAAEVVDWVKKKLGQ